MSALKASLVLAKAAEQGDKAKAKANHFNFFGVLFIRLPFLQTSANLSTLALSWQAAR